MKQKLAFLCTALVLLANSSTAQYASGDHWYNNPLGFEPVKMHTSMGFIIPAVAVGTCLLLTKKDPSLTNRLSVYNESGFSWGYKYPGTFFAQNNTGINYKLRSWMSVGVELGVNFPRDEFNNTTGIDIRPFARFYPVHKDKWDLYFESGGGFVYFFDNFPRPSDQDNRLGTQLNGIIKYGIGSSVRINSSTSVMFGIRHLHVSNGNTKGAERNPSHDSNGFFVGFSWRAGKRINVN